MTALRALMRLGGCVSWPSLEGTSAARGPALGLSLALLAVVLVGCDLRHVVPGADSAVESPAPRRKRTERQTADHCLSGLFLLSPSIRIATANTGLGSLAVLALAAVLVALASLAKRLLSDRTQSDNRLSHFRTLAEFGRAVVEAQLDPEQIYPLVYSYSQRIASASTFLLEMVHWKENRVSVVMHVEGGVHQPERALDLTETVRWMSDTREPLLVDNVPQEGLPFKPHVVGALPGSLLIAPLIAGDDLIGLLSLQDDKTNAFSPDQLELLALMANQAAMAISSARMYQAQERRSRQLAAVAQVGRRVAAILDLDRLFSEVVALVRETFSYDYVAVFTVIEDTRRVTLRASTDPSIEDDMLNIELGEGLVGWVAQHGEPVLANDVDEEERYRFEDSLEATEAELSLPLKIEDRILGVLDVQSTRKNTFAHEDVMVMQTLADQVAIAIEDARLYAAREEQAWTSTALLEVAETLGTAASLDDVLATSTRITALFADVDRCSILLWHQDPDRLEYAHGHSRALDGKPLLEAACLDPETSPLIDHLLHKPPAPLILADSDLQPVVSGQGGDVQSGTLIVLPLLPQSELQGIIVVEPRDMGVLQSAAKRSMLSGIANRVGMAVANARLHIAQREEAWVSTALLQVAQAFVSSNGLRENLATIARLTPLLVGVERCLILLKDGETGAFLPYESFGLKQETVDLFATTRLLPSATPLLAQMEKAATEIRVEGNRGSELGSPELTSVFPSEAFLAVPMRSRGQTQGALLVDCSDAPRRLSSRQRSIVEGIAHQAATAVENATLYEASLERERVAQELRVARDIQVSFLPQACPQLAGWDIAAGWHAARGVGGDYYDFLPLSGDRLGLVIADVSDKGIPAALFMSLSRTLVRVNATDRVEPADVLRRTNELLCRETHSDMFLSIFYGVLDWRTGLLRYANAGHNPPLLYRCSQPTVGRTPESGSTAATAGANGGNAEALWLSARGMVLGVTENVEFEERKAAIAPGDLLVLYTDGVTEPIDPDGQAFGEARLEQAIAATWQRSCGDILRHVRQVVVDFAGDQPQFDDYTLVCVKRESTPSAR